MLEDGNTETSSRRAREDRQAAEGRASNLQDTRQLGLPRHHRHRPGGPCYSRQRCSRYDWHTDKATPPEEQDQEMVRSHTYCALYIAADMLLDEKAKVHTIDGLIWYDREADGVAFGPGTMRGVWADLPSGCGLQRLIIDMWASRMTSERMREFWELCPPRFVAELATRLLEVQAHPEDNLEPREASRCHYHDHEDGAKCE